MKYRKIKRKGDSFLRDALIVGGITLIAGIMIGFVYQLTLKPIDQGAQATRTKAYQSVFTEANEFVKSDELNTKLEEAEKILADKNISGIVVNDVYQAVDASGNKLGNVLVVTSKQGYGGDIIISLGIDKDKKVTGVEIITMSETAGLGAKAAESSFRDQYKGVSSKDVELVKGDITGENQVSAISGATITSKAITEAVKAASVFLESIGE